MPPYLTRVTDDSRELPRPKLAQYPQCRLEDRPSEEAADGVGLVDVAVALQTVEAAAAATDVLDGAGNTVGTGVPPVILLLCPQFLLHLRVNTANGDALQGLTSARNLV